MAPEKYRDANEFADLLDFVTDASRAKSAKPGEFDVEIESIKRKLAEQERLDGRPADPPEQRRGFLGGG